MQLTPIKQECFPTVMNGGKGVLQMLYDIFPTLSYSPSPTLSLSLSLSQYIYMCVCVCVIHSVSVQTFLYRHLELL